MGKSLGLSKKAVVGVVALCVLFAVFAAVYFMSRPQGVAGSKNIRVEIVAGEAPSNTVRTVEIKTEAEFLRQALEEQNLIGGDESEFGLFIKTVGGITADSSRQEWWCITKDGEALMTGVDTTPIADGEHYEITLTAGY